MDNINILITGIGGQGIILSSDVLAETAMLEGYDVKKTDTIGMAQRGGSVISHLRFGPAIYSPLISPGEADMLLSLEKLEAARACRFLKPGGVALVNNYAIPPLPLANGKEIYPDDQIIKSCIGQYTDRVYFIDGFKKAQALGDTRTLNIFMLGSLSIFLPLREETWLKSLQAKLPDKILNINLEAFNSGKRELGNAGFS